MSKLGKVKQKLLAKDGQPYGLFNNELWYLPFDEKASGTKHGDVIAELDDGYLFVYDKTWRTQPQYMPKGMVQL